MIKWIRRKICPHQEPFELLKAKGAEIIYRDSKDLPHSSVEERDAANKKYESERQARVTVDRFLSILAASNTSLEKEPSHRGTALIGSGVYRETFNFSTIYDPMAGFYGGSSRRVAHTLTGAQCVELANYIELWAKGATK